MSISSVASEIEAHREVRCQVGEMDFVGRVESLEETVSGVEYKMMIVVRRFFKKEDVKLDDLGFGV